MEELDNLYLQILKSGLIAIRNASKSGDLARCQIEATHLHNIPSLIGEKNKNRHLYYIGAERAAYLKWILTSERRDLKEFVGWAYLPHWKRMEEILGMDEILRRGKVEE